MKNLKNFNHWISELRSLAVEAKIFNEGDETPMSKSKIDKLFCKSMYENEFKEGVSPKEAFEDTMDSWAFEN